MLSDNLAVGASLSEQAKHPFPRLMPGATLKKVEEDAAFTDFPPRRKHIGTMVGPLVFEDAKGIRGFVREQRRQGKTIGFVPTMVGTITCITC